MRPVVIRYASTSVTTNSSMAAPKPAPIFVPIDHLTCAALLKHRRGRSHGSYAPSAISWDIALGWGTSARWSWRLRDQDASGDRQQRRGASLAQDSSAGR